MDWVDFKRNCARYRKPYKGLAEYCEFLLLRCCREYMRFREVCLNGDPEYACARVYGEFLHYMAEIESLTVDYAKTSQRHVTYEFKMLGDAIDLAMDHRDGVIDDDTFITKCSHWQRIYYGVAYASRFFNDSMKENRRYMIEKFGY